MANQRKRLKLTVLLFATIFLAGAAFAATNGMLAFGGTVRINNVVSTDEARLEFLNLSAVPWDYSILNATAYTDDNNQRLQFDVEIFDVDGLYNEIQTPVLEFVIRNTGNVPARFLGMDEDLFTTAHAFAVVDLRSGDNQVWVTQGLTYGDAELIGIIEPGGFIEGRIRVTGNVVGYYFATESTSFGFQAELLYEQAR